MSRTAALPLMGFLLIGAGTPQEMRELFVVKEFPAFRVAVPEEKADWCSKTANVSVIGDSVEQFTQNTLILQRIVGGIRAVMSFECPEANKLQLTGNVQGQPLYQAFAVATNNWALEGAELRSLEQLKLLDDLKIVDRCDELAGSPDDPESMTAGVADSNLDGIAIVSICNKAITIDNETPRLKYQLARGFLRVGQDEEALEQLIEAAEAGHGGSLALLGDIHLTGAAGVEVDPAAARLLYEKAAALKFEPARLALARFEDQTEIHAQAEAEEKKAASAPAPMMQPVFGNQKIVNAASIANLRWKATVVKLQNRRFDNFSGAKGLTFHYANNFMNGYRAVCPNLGDIYTTAEYELITSWLARYSKNIINIFAVGAWNQNGQIDQMASDGQSDGGEMALAENCSGGTLGAASKSFVDLINSWVREGD